MLDATTGQLVAEYTYDAYGNPKIVNENENFGTALLGAIVTAYNPLLYRGYAYSVLGGTLAYYLGSRFYMPQLGRFLNADDTDFIGVGETPISCNMYAYCFNDPVNDTDPSGNISIAFSMAIGAFLGLLGQYIMDVILNLYYGEKIWYKATSSTADYVVAGISGALSMLSVKKLSSVLSASISGMNYIINCWTNEQSIKIGTLIATIGIAIIVDMISGNGINLSNRVGIIKTSMSKIKTLVSKNKLKLYKSKITSNISGIIVNAVRTLIGNVISRISGESKIINKAKNFLSAFWKGIKV